MRTHWVEITTTRQDWGSVCDLRRSFLALLKQPVTEAGVRDVGTTGAVAVVGTRAVRATRQARKLRLRPENQGTRTTSHSTKQAGFSALSTSTVESIWTR